MAKLPVAELRDYRLPANGRQAMQYPVLSRMLLAVLLIAACGAEAVSQEKAAASEATAATNEVVVEATRPELTRRAYSFVSGLTGHGFATESIARWVNPICPFVAGMPREHGEFVLERLSQAILAAGAPLAGRTCRPNLGVVMTAEPEKLLQLWKKRSPLLFGGAAPTAVRSEMFDKPRPVRVWYNTATVCADTKMEVPALSLTDVKSPTGPSGCRIQDSRLTWNFVGGFASVIVIVDSRGTSDINLGQLTDYIAMVGMAQVNPEGDLGNAPTVLRLFAESADASHRAGSLSTWDRAFLKSLYSTQQGSRLQRSRITQQIVQAVSVPR